MKNKNTVYKITCEKPILKGTISLPGSKSISNRALIIEALLGEKIRKQNLSAAKDTLELQEALKQNTPEIQSGEGGATFRFLTSLFALREGEWTLKSSGSMNKRPIGELVDVLRKLGAKIDYAGNTGFPPLKITGGKLKGGKVSLQSNVSSQFISSLLLISPYLPKGLELTLPFAPVSGSYIEMTIKLMQYFGVEAARKKNKLFIVNGKYAAHDIQIEGDWSAASYFYQLSTLSEQADIILKGLSQESLQGDSVVADMFQSMRVVTTYQPKQVKLTRLPEQQLSLFDGTPDAINQGKFSFDLSSNPDLFPALAVLCAAKGWNAFYSGISHLQHKESDRLKVFKQELRKMGVTLKENNGIYQSKGKITPGNYKVDTHNDHRVAMAFAPLAVTLGSIEIQNPEVVTKSYPAYWDDLKKLGLVVEEV